MRLVCLSLGLLLTLPVGRAQSTDPAVGSTPTQPSGPEQPVIQPTTGSSLLQQSLAILTGGTAVNDVTLNGNITITRRGISGSFSKGSGTGLITESGTVTLTAVGDAESQFITNTPSGNRTETRTVSSGRVIEKWTGTDGVAHYNQIDSLLTPHAAWFFPAFMMAVETSSGNQASNINAETHNGAPADHVTAVQPPGANAWSLFSPVINQHEIYLDPSSHLPVSMAYHVNAYPKDPRLIPLRHAVPIPEEIRFGNYQLVQGRSVPFHIQVYVQTNLLYDIFLSSVTFNTGVTIPAIN